MEEAGMSSAQKRGVVRTTILFLAIALVASAFAAPVVKVVPWVAASPAVPHDTYSGRTIYLKATTDDAAVQYYWDYGDATPPMAWTAVGNIYNIGVQHAYTGAAGQPYTATIYVRDSGGNVASAKYYVVVRANTLQVRVNIAIDEGLWRLHREMTNRSGSGSAILGYWDSGDRASSGYVGNTAANATAFLTNGHLPDPDLSNPNPYSETVLRGVNVTLNGIASTALPATVTNAHGTFSTDQNANGLGVYVPENDMYEGGMVMDMVAATGSPSTVAAVGGSGVVGATYVNILQDMMDYYVYCQGVGLGSHSGGWRYGCRYSSSDGSVCQWAAVGILGAVKKFGLSLPPGVSPTPASPSPMVLANLDWVTYSHDGSGFGYDGPGSYPWTPWAVTPSGMVQLAMDGVGRGTPGSPTMFDNAENYIRNNFSGPLGYYYGLFSFTKSMLENPGGSLTQLCGRDGFPSNNLANCVDWYGADTANGDPLDGVAKTLTNSQDPDGFWWASYQGTSTHLYFNTAWAIIMLNKTVFSSGVPVSVIDASPTRLANGGKVNFTGKNSFHQDPSKSIVNWEWDFGTGSFTATGVNQNNIVMSAAPPYPANITVRLRVTDNSTPTPLTAISTQTIVIDGPPIAPTASAGGPYNVCPQPAYLPFFLNGAGSSNPDDGQHDTSLPTPPGDFITQYAWDLLGNGTYTAYGALASQSKPRADNVYSTAGILGSGQTINVGLRVTDNTSLSFPTSGFANLQGFATTQVYLRLATDTFCTKCVGNASAVARAATPGKSASIQLVWTETGAHHYNVYRSTVAGGPYTLLGAVTNISVGSGKSMGYLDNGPLTGGTTYYYRIYPATLADVETCQSNQANASAKIAASR